MLRRLILGFRQIANLKVDRFGFQTASVPIGINESPDPRGLTLREADGDTCPSVANGVDNVHTFKDNNVQLENESGHV